MCQYKYSQFDQCNHRVIEVIAFCPKALWRAGISGILGPCPELAFQYQLAKAFNPLATKQYHGISPEAERKQVWRGMTGFCRGCEVLFKKPKILHTPTHHSTPLSTITMPTTPALINSYNGPSLRPPPTPEHPYVYLPYINRSLYALLSIADQYTEKHQDVCKVLFFPSTVFLYTCFEKWRVPAHVEGVALGDHRVPNRYFTANCGLTPLDRKWIGEEVERGKELVEVWRTRFEQRGTHLDLFLKVAAKGEVYPPKVALPPVERGGIGTLDPQL